MFWFETAHPDTGEALEVEAVYWRPWTGARDGYGAPIEPDEKEAVQICEVRNRAGEPVAFEAFEGELEREAMSFVREAP